MHVFIGSYLPYFAKQNRGKTFKRMASLSGYSRLVITAEYVSHLTVSLFQLYVHTFEYISNSGIWVVR